MEEKINGPGTAGENELVKIIGFGNKFMCDDGIGIRIIEELKETDLANAKNVEIIDGGTSGMDLIFLLKGAGKAIIIDAVDAGQKLPGQIVIFSPDQVREFFKKKRAFKSYSLHDIDLVEVFELLKTLGIKTKIKIIGIKPKKIGFGGTLSPEIENRIPELISNISNEIINIRQ
jgi:hydrogenase maturation protease